MKTSQLFVLFCLFCSPLMAQHLNVQHALRADTLRANVIQRNNGTADQLLLANGGATGAGASNQVLTSQGENATPIWSNTAIPTPSYSLINQTSLQGSNTLRAVGINTNSPNALVAMNATGYAVNKALYLNSNGSVGNNLAYRIHSVSPTGTSGLKFSRDSADIAFIGLQGNRNLVIQTYNNARVGINNANPRTTLDVEGPMVASGYLYAQPWGYGVEYGTIGGGGIKGGDVNLANALELPFSGYYDAKKIDYIQVNGNVTMPRLFATNNIYKGKRIGLIFNGRSSDPTWTITFGNNEYRTTSGVLSTSITTSVGRRYVFFSDGIYWYLESYHTTI